MVQVKIQELWIVVSRPSLSHVVMGAPRPGLSHAARAQDPRSRILSLINRMLCLGFVQPPGPIAFKTFPPNPSLISLILCCLSLSWLFLHFEGEVCALGEARSQEASQSHPSKHLMDLCKYSSFELYESLVLDLRFYAYISDLFAVGLLFKEF